MSENTETAICEAEAQDQDYLRYYPEGKNQFRLESP